MMKRMLMTVLVLGIAVAMVPGCRKDRETENAVAPAEAVQQLFEATMEEITTLQETDGDVAAIARMTEMLSQPAYTEIRGGIFQRLLETLLAGGGADVVLATYLEWARDDATLAEAGGRSVLQAAMQAEDPQIQAERLERLLDADSLPVRLLTAVWQYRMAVYAETGSIAESIGRVDDIMGSKVADNAVTIFSAAFSQGMRADDYAGVQVLLDALESLDAQDADLRLFINLKRGELLLAQDKPAAAWQHYVSLADAIGDSQLSRHVNPVLKTAKRLGKNDLIKQVIDTAYAQGESLPATRDAAAAWAVRDAADSGDLSVLLAATQRARDNGASVKRFYYAFSRGFYAGINAATTDQLNALNALLVTLAEAPGLTDSMLGMIASSRLDVAFFMEDFKSALAIVEAGVPGFDEDWHAELANKIKAHIAQQEGRFADAVTLYTKHMERVAAWEEPVVNPENGQRMIKEVVLGFNEKRIGDIWANVEGHEKDAKAAYARARDWYQKGLDLLENDSAEYAAAKQELAAVPVVK